MKKEDKEILVGSLEWFIFSNLDRYHSSQDCPHKGSCLSKEELIWLISDEFRAWHQSKIMDVLSEIKEYIKSNDGGDGSSQTDMWLEKLDQLIKEVE